MSANARDFVLDYVAQPRRRPAFAVTVPMIAMIAVLVLALAATFQPHGADAAAQSDAGDAVLMGP